MKRSSKTKFIFFADYYLPGINAGGPIKSLSNLFAIIANSFEITLLTRDHDFKAASKYTDVEKDKTKSEQSIKIQYLNLNLHGYFKIFKLIKYVKPEKIFLNSLFSVPFSIYPLLLIFFNLIKIKVIYLAPRGELASSALTYKSLPKKYYLKFLRFTGLTKKIIWVACSEHEYLTIKQFTGTNNVINLPNIGMKPLPFITKIDGPLKSKILKIIFYSRISPIKNISFIYTVLKNISFPVELDLYGPITDSIYWTECEKIRKTLPANIVINYYHSIDLEQFKIIVQKYHLMFLPTEGENFGQAIYECLACGRPVLISDQTPWRELKVNNAGFDLSLKNPEKFEDVLTEIMQMNNEQFITLCEGSLQFAKTYFDSHNNSNDIIKLL